MQIWVFVVYRELKRRRLEAARLQVERSEPALLSENDGKFVEICQSYRVSAQLWDRLYKYQQTGVRWLCELNRGVVGGILGDEMGVGKTVQIITFLAALSSSGNEVVGASYTGLGPVLLVCPTTIMHQWVKQFHEWWPSARVALLHESGSYSGTAWQLVRKMCTQRGILITSYSSLIFKSKLLLSGDWHYVILDEGHKIRNPNAKQALAAKRFRTPYRLILSGTPVQNSLRELWSLFDFVYPGLLGSLHVFLEQFGVPITQGGYANASPSQIQIAYKCACVVRRMISPYLLRRTKEDVADTLCLPSKNEQVLFCYLTDEQKALYKEYLQSDQCASILRGTCQASECLFVGLTVLRKICNHPDLITGMLYDDCGNAVQYGDWRRSGKMTVVKMLLKLWHKQGHRVLLFSQSRKVLTILEMLISRKHYTYLRLDGTTSIRSRQSLIEQFNTRDDIFVLLLTTHVGGLGLNLTGADRVLIYDPDWNPSTDAQARERAWRIGQTKPVTVYRLLSVGTIEEKIYHRQIFKHFLTSRILKDARQRRFFKANDLHELFTFSDDSIESDIVFAGTGSKVQVRKSPAGGGQNIFDEMESAWRTGHQTSKPSADQASGRGALTDIHLSPTKLDELRRLARQLSRSISAASHTETKETNNRTSSEISCKPPHCARVDGVKIPYLKSRVIKSIEDEHRCEKENKTQDDYVLRQLFKKTNVCRALMHDKIVKSGDCDHSLIEAEAERIAAKAGRVLAESRWQVRVPFSTAVLNGRQRFGILSRRRGGSQQANSVEVEVAEEENLFSADSALLRSVNVASAEDQMLSSVDLVAAIQRRKYVYASDGECDEERSAVPAILTEPSPSVSDGSIVIRTRYDRMLEDVRQFVASGSEVHGEATTSEILKRFGSKILARDSAVFKAMLNTVCNFQRRNGQGVWTLKNMFY